MFILCFSGNTISKDAYGGYKMSKDTIQALDNGPFMVNGTVQLVDGEGNVIETKDQCYLCRCGLSSKQPYCNGSHEGKFENKVRSK